MYQLLYSNKRQVPRNALHGKLKAGGNMANDITNMNDQDLLHIAEAEIRLGRKAEIGEDMSYSLASMAASLLVIARNFAGFDVEPDEEG